jgi:hypothetical protein
MKFGLLSSSTGSARVPKRGLSQVKVFQQSREVLTPAVAPSLEQASSELEALGLACADQGSAELTLRERP